MRPMLSCVRKVWVQISAGKPPLPGQLSPGLGSEIAWVPDHNLT